MADIVLSASASTTLYAKAMRGGIFWTSTTIGYAIYADGAHDLVWQKTSDGGETWGAENDLVAPASCDVISYDCWSDWQTAGDAGTKIHIAYVGADLDEVRYVYLDTDGDSVGGDDLIEACQGTGFMRTGFYFNLTCISITKTRGGNLAVAFKYQDSDATAFFSFYTSPDGDAWTSKTTPYETGDDLCMIFAGNEADNQDIWGAYWDTDANEISLKTFDNSGNSWSEQSISESMVYQYIYLQMDGQIRLSDGHLILVAWDLFDNAEADLMCWDINGAGSITEKTTLYHGIEYAHVGVFINQVNDDIYVAYIGGAALSSAVQARYQMSDDGGSTWSGDTLYQADAEEDNRWISAGCMKAAWGGRFSPIWFDDDDNDIFTNFDNSVEIAISGVAVVQGSASGSGVGLASSSAKLDVLASALGNGIGIALASPHLIISGLASGQGIGLAQSTGHLVFEGTAAGSGIGIAQGASFVIVIANADGSGVGISEGTAYLIISADASGSGIGAATTQALLDVLAEIAGEGIGLGGATGEVIVSGIVEGTGTGAGIGTATVQALLNVLSTAAGGGAGIGLANGIRVLLGQAIASGAGTGITDALLDILAQAEGGGIGEATTQAILDILADADGSGIGLGTTEALIKVLAAAAASGEGLGEAEALLEIAAEAAGEGIGSGQATGSIPGIAILGTASGTGLGIATTVAFINILASALGQGIGEGQTPGIIRIVLRIRKRPDIHNLGRIKPIAHGLGTSLEKYTLGGG